MDKPIPEAVRALAAAWFAEYDKANHFPEMLATDAYAAGYAAAQQQGQAPPPSVPEGWVLVPVEPTMEMRSGTGIHHVHAENVWRAMLAAAPALAQQPATDAEWIKHPQTIEAKAQWDAVAQAIGADGDDPDAVLAAAQRARQPAAVDEAMARWVQIAAEGTPSDWQAEQADMRRHFAALAAQHQGPTT